LRLKPNLPQAHLAAGYYMYDCWRDYQKARDHLAIAERLLPNSAEALVLAGYIDRGQGHWAQSNEGFRTSMRLGPRKP
jgi:tetratricopeptide (TPR) repeat protein